MLNVIRRVWTTVDGASTDIWDLLGDTHLLGRNFLRLLLSESVENSEMTDTLIHNGCKTNGPVENGYFKKVRETRSLFLFFSKVPYYLTLSSSRLFSDGFRCSITAVLLVSFRLCSFMSCKTWSVDIKWRSRRSASLLHKVFVIGSVGDERTSAGHVDVGELCCPQTMSREDSLDSVGYQLTLYIISYLKVQYPTAFCILFTYSFGFLITTFISMFLTKNTISIVTPCSVSTVKTLANLY